MVLRRVYPPVASNRLAARGGVGASSPLEGLARRAVKPFAGKRVCEATARRVGVPEGIIEHVAESVKGLGARCAAGAGRVARGEVAGQGADAGDQRVGGEEAAELGAVEAGAVVVKAGRATPAALSGTAAPRGQSPRHRPGIRAQSSVRAKVHREPGCR